MWKIWIRIFQLGILMLCLRISFSRHGSNIRHLWSFSAATRLRAYKFHGNAVRVNASSYEADDRNLLSGEFYCASSYSEHVTEREIARLPKFRSRLGIVNFPIVLRQIFVISARTIHQLVVSQKALCAYELFTPVPSIDGCWKLVRFASELFAPLIMLPCGVS